MLTHCLQAIKEHTRTTNDMCRSFRPLGNTRPSTPGGIQLYFQSRSTVDTVSILQKNKRGMSLNNNGSSHALTKNAALSYKSFRLYTAGFHRFLEPKPLPVAGAGLLPFFAAAEPAVCLSSLLPAAA